MGGSSIMEGGLVNIERLIQSHEFTYSYLDEKKEWNLGSSTKFFFERNFHLPLVTMNKLLQILWTTPVNVCGCERSFPSLQRINTYIKNAVGQERLPCLALINIEKDYQIDIDAIVADFVSKKDERKRIF